MVSRVVSRLTPFSSSAGSANSPGRVVHGSVIGTRPTWWWVGYEEPARIGRGLERRSVVRRTENCRRRRLQVQFRGWFLCTYQPLLRFRSRQILWYSKPIGFRWKSRTRERRDCIQRIKIGRLLTLKFVVPRTSGPTLAVTLRVCFRLLIPFWRRRKFQTNRGQTLVMDGPVPVRSSVLGLRRDCRI